MKLMLRLQKATLNDWHRNLQKSHLVKSDILSISRSSSLWAGSPSIQYPKHQRQPQGGTGDTRCRQ